MFHFPDKLQMLLKPFLQIGEGVLPDRPIHFKNDLLTGSEGYHLQTDPQGIYISYHTAAGAWNGLMGLLQLILRNGGLPSYYEESAAPRFPVRGFLLDISRGRIPKMESLYALADLLALLRYNHLELYIEGFSYAYSFVPSEWISGDAITAEELERFDRYCAARMIELVPCQNSLGHMNAWICKEPYRHLAEAEEAGVFPPSTLNAADPDSLKLVGQMLDDLLPQFSSYQVNVCLDEPFELGKGKNRDADPVQLYLQYVKLLHENLSERGRKMLMWSDFLRNAPDLLTEIPRDIMLLEWGYDGDYPFERYASRLEGRPFLICPGTNSWTSFTGITDSMEKNIRSAAMTAARYGAEGVLLTDWGDFGHLQPMSVSWPPIVLNGMLMWDSREPSDEELAACLDAYAVRESGIGSLMLASGRYALYEHYRMECRTQASMPLVISMMGGEAGMDQMAEVFAQMGSSTLGDKYIDAFRHKGAFREEEVLSFVEMLLREWDETDCVGERAVLVRDEYTASLKLVQFLTHIRSLMEQGLSEPGLPERAEAVIDSLRSVWMKRSRPSEFEQTSEVIRSLADQVSFTNR